MKKQLHKKEEGFLSAFFIIFMVTLALMSAGAYILVNSEGITMVNQIQLLQTGYAADGAAFYGIRALQQSVFINDESLTIGGATVTVDTQWVDDLNVLVLSVNADMSNVQNKLAIQLRADSLRNEAIFSMGSVPNNYNAKDTTGTINWNYLIENADSLPSMNSVSLRDSSDNQSHTDTGTFTAWDTYPNNSFWFGTDVPNVTWVGGDLDVSAGATVFGIFVVAGDVYIRDGAQVQGVIYTPNASSDIMVYRSWGTTFNHVVGGIVTNGSVGSWGVGLNVNVENNPVFMAAFESFLDNPPSYRFAHVFAWNFE